MHTQFLLIESMNTYMRQQVAIMGIEIQKIPLPDSYLWSSRRSRGTWPPLGLLIHAF